MNIPYTKPSIIRLHVIRGIQYKTIQCFQSKSHVTKKHPFCEVIITLVSFSSLTLEVHYMNVQVRNTTVTTADIS